MILCKRNMFCLNIAQKTKNVLINTRIYIIFGSIYYIHDSAFIESSSTHLSPMSVLKAVLVMPLSRCLFTKGERATERTGEGVGGHTVW